MKNIYKISAVLFIGVCFIVSSCKKEEIVINGCTDSSAMNYLSNATSNDGSCIFAYVISQGLWDIETTCQELTITILTQSIDVPLNDMFPDTIEITGEENNVVSMDINGENILADVSYDGTVTIQDSQTISFDTSDFDPTGFVAEVEVVITGSGTIFSDSSGNLSLALSFEILGTPQSSTCEITFSR